MNETSMTLLRDWSGRDPSGWWMSEKFDGCRAYWDGSQFWTRGGNVINAPDWFTAGLPASPLDGEIWMGRGTLGECSVAVRFGRFTGRETFRIFDNPAAAGTWSERMAAVAHQCPHAQPVEFSTVESKRHLVASMKAIQRSGGEGLVIRHPAAQGYVAGRTPTALKVK